MTIPEIKSRLSLMEVIAHYGLKADKQKRVCCPFHNDTIPSLQLYPNTNTWTCFSSNCNAGSGDVIDFIMKKDTITKHQAILKAKELIGVVPSASPVQQAVATITEENQEDKTAFLHKVFSYFQNGLKVSLLGKEYLKKRGLDEDNSASTELAAGLSGLVGYNSGQFHHSEHGLMEGSIKYGLLVPAANKVNTGGAGYNIWAKVSLAFPLRNKLGQITGFYARSLSDNKNNRHYYLKNSEGLYPCYPSPLTEKLIIPESIIDAATLLKLSVIRLKYAVLASYGTNRFTDEHIAAVKEWAGSREGLEIIFFFDGDEAGKKAVEKYTEQLKTLLPQVKISNVNTLENEDVNSIYLKYGKETLLQLLNEASPNKAPLNLPPSAGSGQAGETLHQVQNNITDEPVEHIKKTTLPAKATANPPPSGELEGAFTGSPEALVWQNEQLHIMVLGGIKLSGLDRLKVTLKIKSKHNHYTPLRHNLDLYHSEQLLRLKNTISEQLEVSFTIADTSINELIEQLENYRLERIIALQPLQPLVKPMDNKEIEQVLTYLKHPNLMSNTLMDIGKTGIVGELHNRFIMYLVFLSRITQDPLHIISFGASGTGKTYLQEGIAKLIPTEDKLEITTLSGNALYYFKDGALKHKAIIIEDYDGVQEGLYPLRELSTKQKITKTVSLKDNKGNIKTFTFTVEGPVSIAGCTTKESVYEDNANRCILIYLDISAEQDERIMDYQRKASAGLINTQEEEQYQTLLKNIQRFIKPIKVINPYAPFLKIPSNVLKPRRSHKLYLRFIEIITLYNQHQRKIKTNAHNEPYIESTFEDIAWTNKLLKDILIRKADELTTSCRNFLERLKKHQQKKNEKTFKTREIRSELKIHPSSLKKYLIELYASDYIKIAGGSKAKGYLYEITSYEEYEQLQSSINNVLDELLEKIKKNTDTDKKE